MLLTLELKACALTWLHLDSNRIERIPECISQLKNLRFLSINHNWVQAIPPEVGALVNLRRIMVRNNLVNKVCEEVGALSLLEIFDLTDNRFAWGGGGGC